MKSCLEKNTFHQEQLVLKKEIPFTGPAAIFQPAHNIIMMSNEE